MAFPSLPAPQRAWLHRSLPLWPSFPAAVVVALGGLKGGAAALVLAPILGVVYRILRRPVEGLWWVTGSAFFLVGLTRLVPAPLGLAVDGLLALSLTGLLFQHRRFDFRAAQHPLVGLVALWMGYTLLELFNPEAHSRLAWFYAMRGTALYWLLTLFLGFVLVHRRVQLVLFLRLWLGISLLAALYGMKQKFVGLFAFEWAWLNAGAATTHLLFGKLRVFSFYSDAGQFGAAMGHALVVSGILAVELQGAAKRRLYGLVAAACLVGLFISGTRGALAVPGLGSLTYLFLSKRYKILLLGLVAIGVVFFVLKYTHIGQGVYAVNRMRTALDPDDPSLQVRLENQRKLARYLDSRPFGGGVGSAGSWGLRFSPNTFLAQTPTDSWYVRLWAEYGIVGLWLYLGIMGWFVVQGARRIWTLDDPWLRPRLMALFAGIMGILLASYGNSVLGQMPTAMVTYLSMVFILKARRLSSASPGDAPVAADPAVCVYSSSSSSSSTIISSKYPSHENAVA
jgi:hypothetical protein